MSLKESLEKKIYIRSKKEKEDNSLCTTCICNECSMNYITDGSSLDGLCMGCEMCLDSKKLIPEPNNNCPIGKK